MKREDRKLIIGILIAIFIMSALIGKYTYYKWQTIKKISVIDKNDEFRIEKIEKSLESEYKLGFAYKKIDYHNGEKYYLFQLDKTPEIEVRAN